MAGMDAARFEKLVASQAPFAERLGLRVDSMAPGDVQVRLPYSPDFVRPGGTVAGPAMMGLADFAMYVLILSLDASAVMAVTTSLHINFLRPPMGADIVARGEVLRMGRRLAFLEVTLFVEGEAEPVAHATGTYALPPKRQGAGKAA